MYRITVACYGIPASAGEIAASEIAAEFTEHRSWHSNVKCNWNGGRLELAAENDFDSNGLALLDEFSDAIAACISEPFDGEIKVESIQVFGVSGRADR